MSTSSISEFVGSIKYGDTVGLVIANVDSFLHENMGLDKKYRSIGQEQVLKLWQLMKR